MSPAEGCEPMIKESATWTIPIVVLCSFVGLRHVSAQPATSPAEPAASGSQAEAKAHESDAKPASAQDVLAEVIEVRGRVELRQGRPAVAASRRGTPHSCEAEAFSVGRGRLAPRLQAPILEKP